MKIDYAYDEHKALHVLKKSNRRNINNACLSQISRKLVKLLLKNSFRFLTSKVLFVRHYYRHDASGSNVFSKKYFKKFESYLFLSRLKVFDSFIKCVALDLILMQIDDERFCLGQSQ